ncbi:hypothetical protein [Pyrodictium abyssi]|uniref:Uncharacterized protein n=1 Tax=Pyrodictium abyssi TaxID=54256 RepID=A0ABM8IXK2_9CREN|nr:hypothetical protein PABY_18250 [Pyrodictium abyssi]
MLRLVAGVEKLGIEDAIAGLLNRVDSLRYPVTGSRGPGSVYGDSG